MTTKKYIKIKDFKNVEKRRMLRMADMSKIFGVNGDKFFEKSEKEIKQAVKYMDHATRFYIGVKFYRKLDLDFEPNANVIIKYTKSDICNLLGINRTIIKKFLARRKHEKESVKVIMKKMNYLSPVEFRPKLNEKFFEKYATNYDELKVGGVFKNRV